MSTSENTRSVSIKTVLITTMLIAIIVFVVVGIVVYAFPQNTAVSRIRSVFPYPAIVINGTHAISFAAIDTDIASIRRFYESQSEDLSKEGIRIDFSTPDGKKRLMIRERELLNKMIEDQAIQILASERNIHIAPDAVSIAVDEKINALGNNREDVTKQLDHLYGWTIADFEQKIVQPDMYKDALTKVYADGIDTSSSAKKKIEDASRELQEGASFEDVAKKYSEGQTAQEGGELGFAPVATLAPEISQAVTKQKLQQVSNVIESPLGFHLVVVEERKQEQGQDIVRLKQIFTKKITFTDWLTEQMKGMNITVLFKGYMWDKETARIEFKQPEMKLFEENILQTSQGDASILF